jgi:acetyltransferase-like isoleucine patch superfamily enzyme
LVTLMLKQNGMLRRVINLLLNPVKEVKFKSLLKQKNVVVNPTSVCDTVTFGSNIRIGKQVYLYNTTIADYTYVAGFNSIMNARIGKFCSIAENVGIGLGKHPVNQFVSTSPVFYSTGKQCGATFADKKYFEETGTVYIGNDVWIGAQCVILDDVIIGDGAIIAANSVVNTNVPAYSIYGGTPARLLKMRFNDADIAFLQRFKWWEKEESWHKDNVHLMHDIELLKEKFLHTS